MNWPALETMTQTLAQTLAQTTVERILNALPLGLLIAVFAWGLLRVLRRQNSGTRFAVWFLALLTVAALPVLGGLGEGRSILRAGMPQGTSWGSMRSAITIPARWAVYVFLVWTFGAGAALVRLAAGLWRLRRLRQSCTGIAAGDLDPAVQRTVETITASGAVTIATSEYVRVPAAIGFWKRTIVLPAWALRELPPADLNVILLHEFAHLRRWDDWTNLIQKIVGALFFFHPAVWWIESRLSVEREMACDDAVLAETANPQGYATCLVSLLEKSLTHRISQHAADKRWSMVQAAVNRAREASLRLAQILDSNRPAATRIWRPALGAAGAFSVVCLLALPHAPQLVAFDRGLPAGNSDHAYVAAIRPYSLRPALQPAAQTATVIPAAWRTGEPSPVATAKVVPAQNKNAAVHRFAGAQSIAARSNSVPARERIVAIRASADEEMVPEFQTLVFVEATQYGTADSSLWRVQVWRVTRVTFFSAVGERLARVPVANSI